ncbi:MAG TPA: hypothetical protein VHA56_20105 [Mucilaginibacter sp.]|nr:hypothetical protein [Mucilaginibacter sp.]
MTTLKTFIVTFLTSSVIFALIMKYRFIQTDNTYIYVAVLAGSVVAFILSFFANKVISPR